jgi:hypothetical protein
VGSTRVLSERRRVYEEGRNEVDATCARDLGMLRELGLPTVGGRALTKVAGVASKGRGKCLAVVFELVGVSGVSGNVVAEGGGVVGGAARKDPSNTPSVMHLATKRK